MKIKQLVIENWKSIEKLELNEPNPFSVFVGPNASGKSNIFEALSYVNYSSKIQKQEVDRMFGGVANFRPRINNEEVYKFTFKVDFGDFGSEYKMNEKYAEDRFISSSSFSHNFIKGEKYENNQYVDYPFFTSQEYSQFFLNHLHVFINKKDVEKIESKDDLRLSGAGGNLAKVLKRILLDKNKRIEVIEWLQLLIPGLDNIEIKSEELSGTDVLLIYEKGTKKPFSTDLISDGTYNILSLLTAVFQSDEPQFLLIEEPENGLNPKVIKELVGLFRQKCDDEGHFIWLNTHSQTLVNNLKEDEIILVDKIDGITKTKQIKKGDASGLPIDEAWLTNTLGGGIPW